MFGLGYTWDGKPADPRYDGRSAGVPVHLPPLRDVPGVDIRVEIAGVPAGAALTAGRALPSGLWVLERHELPGLRIRPAGDAAGQRLPGPLALQVTFVATDRATGRAASMTTTVDVAVPWDGARTRAARRGGGVRYLLADDAGGRFAIDPYSGLVSVADDSVFDPASPRRHRITVQMTAPDGSITLKTYEIALCDNGREFSITELVPNSAAVEILPHLPAARIAA